MMDKMSEFLRRLEQNMGSGPWSGHQWHRIIQPAVVNTVLDTNGTGEPALTY